MMSDYQKFVAQTPPPTDAAKQNRQRQIQEKQQAYADSQTAFNQEAQDRQTQLMGPVMQSVKDMLEKVREEKGYSLILDSQAVLDGDRNLDITDDVVARLKIAAASKRDSAVKKDPTPSHE
jgi:outer membrane protein